MVGFFGSVLIIILVLNISGIHGVNLIDLDDHIALDLAVFGLTLVLVACGNALEINVLLVISYGLDSIEHAVIVGLGLAY